MTIDFNRMVSTAWISSVRLEEKGTKGTYLCFHISLCASMNFDNKGVVWPPNCGILGLCGDGGWFKIDVEVPKRMKTSRGGKSHPRSPRIKKISSPRILIGNSRIDNHLPIEFPTEALPIILSFLPVFPDRISCQLVCRDWKNSLNISGLTEDFILFFRRLVLKLKQSCQR